MARKFDTEKLINDKTMFKQCFMFNDDFLDKAYDVYEKKYKNYSEKWRQDNWDSFVDSLIERYESMRKKLQKQIDTKK